MKKLRKRLVGDGGFTLIELLAVIAILAIIAGIGVPKVWTTIQNAKVEAAYANMILARSAVERLLLDLEISGSSLSVDSDNVIELDDYAELPSYISVTYDSSTGKITISYTGDLSDNKLSEIDIDVPDHIQPQTK